MQFKKKLELIFETLIHLFSCIEIGLFRHLCIIPIKCKTKFSVHLQYIAGHSL